MIVTIVAHDCNVFFVIKIYTLLFINYTIICETHKG